jgi:hypothetical protein
MPRTDFSPIPDIAAGDRDALADALAERGACRILGLPDAAATRGLRDDLQRLADADGLAPAATARCGSTIRAAATRPGPSSRNSTRCASR